MFRLVFPSLFSFTPYPEWYFCLASARGQRVKNRKNKQIYHIPHCTGGFHLQQSSVQLQCFHFLEHWLVHFRDICICSGHWESPNGHITPGKALEVGGGTRTPKLGNYFLTFWLKLSLFWSSEHFSPLVLSAIWLKNHILFSFDVQLHEWRLKKLSNGHALNIIGSSNSRWKSDRTSTNITNSIYTIW